VKKRSTPPLLDYTTQIAAAKTAMEIQTILAAHGVQRILTDFDGQGAITALTFQVSSRSGLLPIRLPVDPEPVLQVMIQQGLATRFLTTEHAADVAWRIVLHWLKAQMAILEAGMVRLEQVFMGHIVSDSGETLFQRLERQHFLLAPPDGLDDEMG
jgi:hypothetical protein